MFMNSEFIVGLWFLPVVLFILLPLSMFCVWTCVQYVRSTALKTASFPKAAKKIQGKAELAGVR